MNPSVSIAAPWTRENTNGTPVIVVRITAVRPHDRSERMHRIQGSPGGRSIMDSSTFLVDVLHVVNVGARFLLMFCVGMFLAYWLFAAFALFTASVRRRTSRRRPPRFAGHSDELYPARTRDEAPAR